MSSTLQKSLIEFNKLYKLPAPESFTLPLSKKELTDRINKFKDILEEELSEGSELITEIQDGTKTPVECGAMLADWLGDIMIYCGSEMIKYGMEPDVVLSTIMASNMSKLGSDGKPIYDERGKVMKGPHYWKPEPQLTKYLALSIRTSKEPK